MGVSRATIRCLRFFEVGLSLADCLYLTDGDLYLPTELVRGPWDPNSQHGGAPAALMVDRLSKLQPGGRLTRVTIELMRPVPLTPLTLTTSVEKSGRMVQRTFAGLYADGIAVARAEGLHLAATIKDGTAPDETLMRRGPFEVMPGLNEARDQRRPTHVKQTSFSTHAVDIRFVAGRFSEPGPAAAWFRLKVPVVDDEPIHPWSRVAAAADFCNGIGSVFDWSKFVFANADLVLGLSRDVDGEWVGIHAATHASADGVAIAEGQVFDEHGCVGIALQSLLIRPRK